MAANKHISADRIISAVNKHGSQRKAAKALGIHPRTLERTLARMADEAIRQKLLVIDIETSPNIVFTWGLWQQNVAINQIIESGRVLCFAAKWHGDDETMFYSERQKGGHDRMIRAAHRLLCEADAVVGWNSQRFDARWLNAEFKRYGLRRPAGYKHVDLMRAVKKYQFLPSYKLDYTARNLGVGGKVETGGFKLWRDCLDGDREAWRLMEEYNRADTDLTDAVLTDMMHGGWVTGLPNLSVHAGDACPHCGSRRLRADGHYQTQTRRYSQWVCMDCGSPSRSVKCEPGSAVLKEVA